MPYISFLQKPGCVPFEHGISYSNFIHALANASALFTVPVDGRHKYLNSKLDHKCNKGGTRQMWRDIYLSTSGCEKCGVKRRVTYFALIQEQVKW